MHLLLLSLIPLIVPSGGSPVAFRSTPTIQWVDCTQNVPVQIQQVVNSTTWTSNLGALPSSLKCGRLDVPLDYNKPFGDDNKISLGLSTVNPENPKGTIFFNPGGPGEPAQDFAWAHVLNQTSLFSGLEDYQFMMLDTRGTWASTQLNCSQEAFLAVVPHDPKNESDFESIQAASKALADSCMGNTNSTNFMAHLGSEEAVQDWESVRNALGLKTVNLLGISYGTYWFGEYVDRFPDSIDRAALDAVAVHGMTDEEEIQSDLKAIERIIQRADVWCQSNSSCPFHAQGNGSVTSVLQNITDKAAAGQLIGQDPSTGANVSVTADQVQLVTAISMRNSPPPFEAFTQGLALILSGNSSALFIPDEIKAAIGIAVPLLCLDDPIDDNSFNGFSKLRTDLVPQDDSGALLQRSFSWLSMMYCSGWSVPGRPKKKITSKKPFLWITADFDTNTPTEWATFNFEQTSNATLMVRHGDTHGTMNVPGTARDMVVSYLRSGSVGSSPNDTEVTIYEPGSQRQAIATPSSVGFGIPEGDGPILATLPKNQTESGVQAKTQSPNSSQSKSVRSFQIGTIALAIGTVFSY